MSPNEEWRGGEATDEQHEAVEEFIKMLADKDRRDEFPQNPEKALGEPYYSNLPEERRGFLRALSIQELGLLYRLSGTAGDAGLYADHNGFTWCHL